MFDLEAVLEEIFRKRVRVFHPVSKHEKTDETTRRQAEWFYCFRAFGNLLKHEAQGFEISSPTQKISLSYHLNKVSQFRREICMILKKVCMMCMILSPNCSALTMFEYSTTEVTLLKCLSVLSEHVAFQSKWQSADLDLLNLTSEEEENGLATAIPR